jgi:hypothetical protein
MLGLARRMMFDGFGGAYAPLSALGLADATIGRKITGRAAFV